MEIVHDLYIKLLITYVMIGIIYLGLLTKSTKLKFYKK